jgi:hypothetical protein
MKINDVSKCIAVKEGKKYQLSIAQINEVVGIVCDMMYTDPLLAVDLINHGRVRLKKTLSKLGKNRKNEKAVL